MNSITQQRGAGAGEAGDAAQRHPGTPANPLGLVVDGPRTGESCLWFPPRSPAILAVPSSSAWPRTAPSVSLAQEAVSAPISSDDLWPVSPVPLGKYTDFPSNLDHQQVTQPVEHSENQAAYRLGRSYAALWHARQLLKGYGLHNRLSNCGARLLRRSEGVKVFRRPDRVFGRVGGVCMCGSSLACPVCAPRIAGIRVGEIEQAAVRARHEGSRAFLVTFTMPHQRGSLLLDEIRTWQQAFEMANSGRASNAFRADRRGYVNAAEVTYGRNGWHFHRHLLVFSENSIAPDFSAWRDAWRRAAYSVGRYGDGWEDHAFDAREIFDGFDYVQKIGREIASPLTKASRSIIGLLLEDFDAPGLSGPAYCEAVWTLQQTKVGAVRWSRGLRKSLGLADEVTDEQAAVDTATPTDELLGALSCHQWERVVRMNLEARLVQVAQAGRSSLNDFLVEYSVGPLDSDFSRAPE